MVVEYVHVQSNKLLKREISALSPVTGGSIPNGDVHTIRNEEKFWKNITTTKQANETGLHTL
jgi:hypothetical protein